MVAVLPKKTPNKKLPSNYVVRRLSDVKVLPKSLRKDNQQPSSDIHYESPQTENNTSEMGDATTVKGNPYDTPYINIIDLDDGLIDDDLNNVPYASDIHYDQTTKTIHSRAPETDSTDPDDPDSKASGDAKTPLPKPKKPPNLPQ